MADNINFDDLLKQLPQIAEVVNKFSSEEVQKMAFNTVLEALDIPQQSRSYETKGSAKKDNKKEASTNEQKSAKRSSVAKKGPKSVKADAKLNLYPSNKQSFKDFVEKKKPSSNDEKNVVSVYYLLETLGQSSVTVSQVVTCYEDRKWRIPADIVNSLQYTASQKHWVDTENREAITLGIQGKNHINHDMPKKN